jgi:S-adenosylmethionine:tRNA ribosyltransferase-isomerase
MDVACFDYELPPDAIAQRPVEPRDAARLLVDRGPGPVEHRRVNDLPELLTPGDVLVVNATRVLRARLRLQKPTGGGVEVLLLARGDDGWWSALVRPGRRVAAGTVLRAGDDLAVEIGDGDDGGQRRVRLHTTRTDEQAELAALERHGEVPLPPYIHEALDDPERYQTVFARAPGSVAAPTAGLHLTAATIERCRRAGIAVHEVELDVGLGTFKPMTTTRVDDHVMHTERFRVTEETLAACDAAARVVAIGTTTVRALETASHRGVLEGSTDLFIHSGFEFHLVDRLLTNFHAPRSSLLVLVEAFVGPRWRELYRDALSAGYRFLSFGDAMLIDAKP